MDGAAAAYFTDLRTAALQLPDQAGTLTAVLVVQERFRFFRESMTACLRQQLDSLHVVDGVRDAVGLLDLAERRPLDNAVIEADGVPWDVPTLVTALQALRPGMRLIGLFRASRPAACDGMALLPRTVAPEQITQLVQPGADRTAPFLLTATTSGERGP